MLGWVVLLWAGWTLVFAAGETALSYSSTGEYPGWTGRVYFAGYTLFTLGIGNVVPQRGAWEIVTVVASGSGMLFVTLGISYVLSLLGAVVGGRAFAASVGGLGEDAEEIARRAWEGERYAGLTIPLAALSSQLDALTQQHLTYPVLHYYHARDPDAAPSSAVAVLDEALTLLRFGVPASPPRRACSKGRAPASRTTSRRSGEPTFIRPTARHAPRASTVSAPLAFRPFPTKSSPARSTASTRAAGTCSAWSKLMPEPGPPNNHE